MAPFGMYSMVPHMVTFMVVNSIICFLALAVVGLRIHTRLTTKAGLGYDDALILLSMAAGVALLVLDGILCTSGIGHPVGTIGNNAIPLLKLITAQNALFIGATIASKLSISLFYLRIFVGNTKTRRASYLSMVFFVVWAAACLVDLFLVCRPDANGMTADNCNRTNAMQEASLFCIIGDIVMLLIPIPAIWKLKMNRRNKIKLTLLFLLGFIVTIIAIVRCVSISQQDFNNGVEFAIMFQDPLAYAVLEPNMGILCASLPMVHNELSAWKDELFGKIKSRSEPQPNDSQVESGQADWDPRYGYTVSITAGKDNHGQTTYTRSASSSSHAG